MNITLELYNRPVAVLEYKYKPEIGDTIRITELDGMQNVYEVMRFYYDYRRVSDDLKLLEIKAEVKRLN